MTLTTKEGIVLKAGNPREAEGSVKVKFIRNKVYEGISYGPDYDQQVVEVKPYWARIFQAQRVAVVVTEEVDGESVQEGDAVLKGIQDLNVEQAAAQISDIEDLDLLDEAEEEELAHPKYEGGRKKVLEAIAARRAELQDA